MHIHILQSLFEHWLELLQGLGQAVAVWQGATPESLPSPFEREPGCQICKALPVPVCTGTADSAQLFQVSSNSLTPTVLHSTSPYPSCGVLGQPSRAKETWNNCSKHHPPLPLHCWNSWNTRGCRKCCYTEIYIYTLWKYCNAGQHSQVKSSLKQKVNITT